MCQIDKLKESGTLLLKKSYSKKKKKNVKFTSYIHPTELSVKGQNVYSSKWTNGIRNQSTYNHIMVLYTTVILELSNCKKAIKPSNHNHT